MQYTYITLHYHRYPWWPVPMLDYSYNSELPRLTPTPRSRSSSPTTRSLTATSPRTKRWSLSWILPRMRMPRGVERSVGRNLRNRMRQHSRTLGPDLPLTKSSRQAGSSLDGEFGFLENNVVNVDFYPIPSNHNKHNKLQYFFWLWSDLPRVLK